MGLEKREDSVKDLWHSGYRYALSLTHDEATAEDIIQDAWLAVLNAQGPETQVYLFSAVRSRFLNKHKREQVLSVVPLNEDAIQTELQEFVCQPQASSHMEKTILANGLGELRRIEREILYLMTIEGYTANEVSVFTEQPRNTVLSHIHRAKKKLRRFLEVHYQEAVVGE